MQAAKQITLSRNDRRSAFVSSRCRWLIESIHREAELGLPGDRRDLLDRGERLGPRGVVGQVRVQQGQVELDVYRLLEQLPRQVEPGLRRVDVLVQVEHQVVRDDRVAGGEERDEPVDQVAFGR